MNTETPVITATPYVPPQMTIVPLRASGAMLLGSATVKPVGTLDFESETLYYEGQYGGTPNTATEWSSLDDGGWGNSFF